MVFEKDKALFSYVCAHIKKVNKLKKIKNITRKKEKLDKYILTATEDQLKYITSANNTLLMYACEKKKSILPVCY
jgi:hypothetical protein